MMKIKNWKDFQHFKDRCPPWIKLHRSILDQRDIATLSDSAFRVLVMLWLLASEDKKKQGNLPTVEDIAFRTRKPKEMISKNLQELCNFLISDDDTVMTERYRVGPPETETETEGETEKEIEVEDKTKQKTFKQLTKEEFKEECIKTSEGILDEVDGVAFYLHWSEVNSKGKMKFQLNDTWETRKRMLKWASNAEKWASQRKVQQ